MDKQILFVSGVARSGTSALVNFLNQHNSILLGQERFYFPINDRLIKHDFFIKDRFLNILDGDTHSNGGFSLCRDELLDRYERAVIIGDKFPNLFKHFDYIFKEFPNSLHICIIRNPFSVVESYDMRYNDKDDSWCSSFIQGMDDWNASVRSILNVLTRIPKNILIVSYEEIFYNKTESDKMFNFLQLASPDESIIQPLRDKYSALSCSLVPRRDDLRKYVSLHADWYAYYKIVKLNRDVLY